MSQVRNGSAPEELLAMTCTVEDSDADAFSKVVTEALSTNSSTRRLAPGHGWVGRQEERALDG